MTEATTIDPESMEIDDLRALILERFAAPMAAFPPLSLKTQESPEDWIVEQAQKSPRLVVKLGQIIDVFLQDQYSDSRYSETRGILALARELLVASPGHLMRWLERSAFETPDARRVKADALDVLSTSQVQGNRLMVQFWQTGIKNDPELAPAYFIGLRLASPKEGARSLPRLVALANAKGKPFDHFVRALAKQPGGKHELDDWLRNNARHPLKKQIENAMLVTGQDPLLFDQHPKSLPQPTLKLVPAKEAA